MSMFCSYSPRDPNINLFKVIECVYIPLKSVSTHMESYIYTKKYLSINRVNLLHCCYSYIIFNIFIA